MVTLDMVRTERAYACKGPHGPPYGKVEAAPKGYAKMFDKMALNIKEKPNDKTCFEKQANNLFAIMTKNYGAKGLDQKARDAKIAATPTGKADLQAYCKVVAAVGGKKANPNCPMTVAAPPMAVAKNKQKH